MKFKSDKQRKAVMANLNNDVSASEIHSSVAASHSVKSNENKMLHNFEKISEIENSLKNRTSRNDSVDPERTMPVFMIDDGSFVGWGDENSQHQKMIIPYARELGIDPKIDDDDPRSYRTQFQFMKQTGMIRATSTKNELFVHVVGKISNSQLKRIRELSAHKKLIFDLEPQYQGEFGWKRDDKIYGGSGMDEFIKGLRQHEMIK